MNPDSRPSAVWTALALLVGAVFVIYLTTYVWRRVATPPTADDPYAVIHKGDFPYFYYAAQGLASDQDIYAMEAPGKGRAGYIYPPMIAFFYQPLGKLSLIAAARASLLVNMTAIALALFLAADAFLRSFHVRPRWPTVLFIAVAAALLSTDKIKGELQMLQTNALVTLGIIAGLWLLDRHPWLAGLALGFSINIKYQALALLAYLLFRKRWKESAATVVGALFFAFLPALTVGFVRECHYLVQAFSGVLRLVGINLGNDVANVEPISAGFSVSITSAAARLLERVNASLSPYVLAGMVVVVWIVVLIALYRSRKFPIFFWPKEAIQAGLPWSAVVGIEWILVLSSVLAFSPQTNTRHLVLTCLVNALGLVTAVCARGNRRMLAIAGLVILWLGLNMPPGNQVPGARDIRICWQTIGGATWSLLVAAACIGYAGMTTAQEINQAESAVELTDPTKIPNTNVSA